MCFYFSCRPCLLRLLQFSIYAVLFRSVHKGSRSPSRSQPRRTGRLSGTAISPWPLSCRGSGRSTCSRSSSGTTRRSDCVTPAGFSSGIKNLKKKVTSERFSEKNGCFVEAPACLEKNKKGSEGEASPYLVVFRTSVRYLCPFVMSQRAVAP